MCDYRGDAIALRERENRGIALTQFLCLNLEDVSPDSFHKMQQSCY